MLTQEFFGNRKYFCCRSIEKNTFPVNKTMSETKAQGSVLVGTLTADSFLKSSRKISYTMYV